MTTSVSSKTAVTKPAGTRTWSIAGLLVGIAVIAAGFHSESAVVGSVGAIVFLASVIFLASIVLNPRFIPGKLLSIRTKRK